MYSDRNIYIPIPIPNPPYSIYYSAVKSLSSWCRGGLVLVEVFLLKVTPARVASNTAPSYETTTPTS